MTFTGKFVLAFLSRTFSIHRTAEEGEYLSSLTPDYHFHPLHRHLDIRWAITAESLPLHIARSQIQTGLNIAHTHTHKHTHTHTHIYIYTYIYIHIDKYMYICIYMLWMLCIYVCICLYIMFI